MEGINMAINKRVGLSTGVNLIMGLAFDRHYVLMGRVHWKDFYRVGRGNRIKFWIDGDALDLLMSHFLICFICDHQWSDSLGKFSMIRIWIP